MQKLLLEQIIDAKFVDTNLQYGKKDYHFLQTLPDKTCILEGWKNEKVHGQMVLTTGGTQIKKLKVSFTDFIGERDFLSSEKITPFFIKPVKAYTGFPGYADENREIPLGNRTEANEILTKKETIDIPICAVQNIWFSIEVPPHLKAGNYTGEMILTAENASNQLSFSICLIIANATLSQPDEFRKKFDIELWQNPFAVAEYYEVEAFSEQHFSILKSHMDVYKKIGGDAITATVVEEAWGGQTYSRNKIKFPSMVKWIEKDGSFTFDYTWFDKWISFNKEMGLGDKIICFGLVPWNDKLIYFDFEDQIKELDLSEEKIREEILTVFLRHFVNHLEEKGWFDQTFIGIDERGFSKDFFDLVARFPNSKGKCLKTAGAMDAFVEKEDLAILVDDLSIGSVAVKENTKKFQELRTKRAQKGLKTTIYSCTGHLPGNFSLSAPGESYWTIMYAAAMNSDGFLRWAYDSWVENPLEDTTHSAFEAGDCFLVFPDEKNQVDPKAQSSVRLEKLAEGVRDANKLFLLKDNEFCKEQVGKLLDKIKSHYESEGCYLTENGKRDLAKDMTSVKKEIHRITNHFIV